LEQTDSAEHKMNHPPVLLREAFFTPVRTARHPRPKLPHASCWLGALGKVAPRVFSNDDAVDVREVPYALSQMVVHSVG
jgi:hypothetical protein